MYSDHFQRHVFNISVFITQPFFTWILTKVPSLFSPLNARSWLNTGIEKMPVLRKSWVWTTNFWNKPQIGSFIQKIYSHSNSFCYPFKNNLHLFKWLKSSIRKQSSSIRTAEVTAICSKKSPFVWMAEVIHSKKGISSKKKIIINSKIPCISLLSCL